jgi:hypothetical protein
VLLWLLLNPMNDESFKRKSLREKSIVVVVLVAVLGTVGVYSHKFFPEYAHIAGHGDVVVFDRDVTRHDLSHRFSHGVFPLISQVPLQVA